LTYNRVIGKVADIQRASAFSFRFTDFPAIDNSQLPRNRSGKQFAVSIFWNVTPKVRRGRTIDLAGFRTHTRPDRNRNWHLP